MDYKVRFNKAFIAGCELHYIAEAVVQGNIGGDGIFSQRCCRLMQERFGVPFIVLTPSCTAALELAVLSCDIGPGDDVLLPSFTFVSTANAVARTGANPVFVEIRADTLNIDESLIEAAVTNRTRAIMPVHYAGVGCEMDEIVRVADRYDLTVIEDAAQGVNAFYKGRALGSIGQLGTYSFHETKNFICGEGGALCINDHRFRHKAEIIRDKGTDRQRFFRGEVQKYQWIDLGSSYIPSEITSAFLYGQLEQLEPITRRRKAVFQFYYDHLEELEAEGLLRRPVIPDHCESNFHLFYILLPSRDERDALESRLADYGIQAITHFEPLHSSPKGQTFGYRDGDLPITESVSARILRLPLYFGITEEDQAYVVASINEILRVSSNSRVATAAGP